MGRNQRLRKARKLQKLMNQSEAALLTRHKNSSANEDAIVLHAPPGVEKMSEVVEAYAAPWLKDAADHDEFQSILITAMTAWNVGLCPKDQRAMVCGKALSNYGPSRRPWSRK